MPNKTEKYKYTAKDYFKLVLILAFFGIIIFFILKFESVPTPVATDAQVWDVLVDNGYEPQDLTQQHLEKEPQSGLVKNITATKGDIHFEFNIYESYETASDIWADFKFYIWNRETNPDSGYFTGRGNYSIYSNNHTKDGKDYSLVQVGNTIAYAFCNDGKQSNIQNVLISIGYMNPSQFGKAISKTSMSLIAIAIYFIVLRTLTWISLDWIWSLICKSAGLTKQEVRLYRAENIRKISYKSSSYYYILQRAKKPKQFKAMYFGYKACFIPVWAAIVTEFISLFTSSPNFNSGPFAMAGICITLIGGLGRMIYNRIYLPNHKDVQ